MEIFKCSESRVKIDLNGTISIFLPDGAGVLKISGPEALAITAQVCAVTAEQANVPKDFIERIQETLKKT